MLLKSPSGVMIQRLVKFEKKKRVEYVTTMHMEIHCHYDSVMSLCCIVLMYGNWQVLI